MDNILAKMVIEGKAPTTNHMYAVRQATAKNKKQRYLKPEVVAWQSMVQLTARKYRRVIRDYAVIGITFHFYRSYMPDVDNLLKATMDALKQALDLDDRYFDPVTSYRYPPIKDHGKIVFEGVIITITSSDLEAQRESWESIQKVLKTPIQV